MNVENYDVDSFCLFYCGPTVKKSDISVVDCKKKKNSVN